jgi:hypothetical protein
MADKQPEGRLRKYRVLKDFKDLGGRDHKADDEIELTEQEARGPINAGNITAELKSEHE